MPKSKAHKYWNKFTGWASHDGQVRAEMLQALDEFLVNPSLIPAEAQHSVRQLFEGWFLLERKLIRAQATPMDLFLRAHERKLSPAELDIYRRFAAENRFGFFKVESVSPGESLELKLLPDGKRFHVVELSASQEAEKGAYVITRLVPFEDHWAMPSLVAAYPDDCSYVLDRMFGETGRKLKPGELRPRHVLALFMPKVDWLKAGLPRVKARLAMFLQRWAVPDLTASMVDEDIQAAHQRRDLTHPLLKKVLNSAPSPEEAREAAEVLAAWWNLTLPEPTKGFPRGPKEMMLLGDLQRVVASKLGSGADTDEKAAGLARELMQEWLHKPQKELDGKTPLEVISKERKALGDPREELGVRILPTKLDIGGGEAEGAQFANQATDYLLKKDAARALECLKKAYPLMKDDPDVFRVLGKMGTAYAMLGRREQALEALRAALKANPDYESARNNLHLLENMTPEEFVRKHKAGFFEQVRDGKG